jgi:hypothetical protein
MPHYEHYASDLQWDKTKIADGAVRLIRLLLLPQGPQLQPESPLARSSGGAAANGPYGTPPVGANAFATPASAASHHSFEDEETLLLDPQARRAAPRLIWLRMTYFGPTT